MVTNNIKIFTQGDALYDAMLDSIASAKRAINLESYIFSSDTIGWMFAKALANKAREGVKVRVLIDAAGSFFHFSRNMRKFLKQHGVKVRFFHHWSWRQPFRYNHRNHRKLLIIDNHLVYLGGFNIHKESSYKLYGNQHWRDTHIALSGPASQKAIDSFEKFWSYHLSSQRSKTKNNIASLKPGQSQLYQRHLRYLYRKIWPLAKKTIYLTTPYFVPDRRTQHGLIRAAQRGIDVKVLLPRKSDVPITRWAARAAYANLLHAGVRIYEYLPRMLHAKTLVVDGQWSSIGTANMDYRSFFLNYEINLFSYKTPLCTELEKQFLEDLTHAEEISAVKWPERPWSERITEAIGWFARRWL